jgi:mannose-1-phosphate guanylyltransferase
MTNMRFFSRFDTGKADRHAVILAGGDGTRLRSLTRLISGDERPKQFSPILDGETLLDRTRKRTALAVAPENTFFSLTAKHERYFEEPLRFVAPTHMVVQPENRGTAPAILYTLLRIAASAPDATVAIFPSDHYFGDDESFMEHVEAAFSAVDHNQESVVLLGIEPEMAEPSYGWIEPAESLFGGLSRAVSRVSRFWEKPTAGVAEHLLAGGCLWNSFDGGQGVNVPVDVRAATAASV